MTIQQPHRWFPYGFVYFAVCKPLGVVKIGMSNRWLPPGTPTGDPIFAGHNRLRELQTGCPAPLYIAEMVPANVWGKEQDFHHHFQRFRIYGEWFWLVGQVREFVNALVEYGKAVDATVAASKRGEDADTPRPPFLQLDTVCVPNVAMPTGWQVVAPG